MLEGVHITNQKGFTLIEMISVLVIMSVMASVAVKKLDVLSGTATDRVLQEGVRELNVRESLVWTNLKLSSSGWTNDGDVFNTVDKNLGLDFVWTAGPNASGGTLRFRSNSMALNRIPSTTATVGIWN